MARKVALYSWGAAVVITLVSMLFGVMAGGEGVGLWYALFLGIGSFAVAIAATIAWVIISVRDLTRVAKGTKAPKWE